MSSFFEIPNIKVILRLLEVGEARYSELLDGVIGSRSTLALALRELQEDGLVERRVLATRPVQTNYALTVTGGEVAGHLSAMKKLIP
ncbi:MAG: winged helix-turn-helix transcriptional regulator [Candidatus Hodarchaeales archaeon]